MPHARLEFTQSMLPDFAAIDPSQIESQIKNLLQQNTAKLEALLNQNTTYTWANLMAPLEEMSDELNQAWSPVSHLHAVQESESLRKAYNDTLPHLTRYSTALSQNEKLFHAIETLIEQSQTQNVAERKIIENDIRDFKLSGIALPDADKKSLAELQEKISVLMTKFSENVLDATHGFIVHLEDDSRLAGLPAQALQLARDNAALRKRDGFVLTLDYPSYSTAMKFLKDRALRKTLYEAYVTRASDQGPNANRWDNTPIINDILKTRHAIATLLGFASFADYSLATKMAQTKDDVISFLQDLLARSRPFADKEYAEIVAFAKQQDGTTDLAPWDIGYYSEQLLNATFQFSPEDLRPYFPINTVLDGMFAIVNKLYGITIAAQPQVPTWHKDAHFFAIYDTDNTLRAGFYIDLYARVHKRDGAWMDECRARRPLENAGMQYPVAYLTCNFMPPVNDEPALLTHDDVITLFHEFGHCLHHMLTKVDYPAVGGINGVAWDAVEFPSQFMENFCWEKASLDLIAKHYQTGAPMPDELYKKMIAAKYFQTGLQMMRQLEFSLYDFKLHTEFDLQKKNQAQTVLDEVRKDTALSPTMPGNRFQNSFSHIFGGSYAAGYYSYKWAEVLSADAYAKFEETGLFNPATGRAFLENILEVGGTREPMASFVAFRGRKPTIDALLRLSGLS